MSERPPSAELFSSLGSMAAARRRRRGRVVYLVLAGLGLSLTAALIAGQTGPPPGPSVVVAPTHDDGGHEVARPASTDPSASSDELQAILHQARRPSSSPSPEHATGDADRSDGDVPGPSPEPPHTHAPPDDGRSRSSHPPHPSHTPAPPVGTPNPVDCSGYPERRIFLEVQDWWLRTAGANGTDFGHVHVGTCFPYGQTVSGAVDFDVRVVMHQNPGTLRRVDVAIHTGADGEGLIVGVPFDQTCAGTCAFWGRARLDTAAAGADGWQEFRFKARVDEPDGARMVTSTGWAANLVNGNPGRAWRDGSGLTGRGWYTGFGYQNADIAAIPTGPVSGIWRPSIRLGPGAGGTPTTRHVAAIDPDAHAGRPGWVILDGSGEFRGEVGIDTRQLANGAHRLVLRAESALDNGSSHSGLLVISFVVSN